MNTIPSTTVRSNPKRPVTTGTRTIRTFDGDQWNDTPLPPLPKFDAADAFKQIRVVIDAKQLLTAEDLR